MKKYRLEIYGWMMNASAHSVEEKDVESVSDILLDNPENTWELYDYFTAVSYTHLTLPTTPYV